MWNGREGSGVGWDRIGERIGRGGGNVGRNGRGDSAV